ncbi:MAG TPA: hypothetical protein VN578_08275 [Candidatus Binatia bacterium]|nr:hypothetical protein [Candidatus Binatia bacterium]
MKLSIKAWQPMLDWSAPAGRLLKRLLAALPPEYPFQITVFGSAPLQLAIDRSFLSADVDIFSEDDFSEVIREEHLGKGHRRPYLEQVRAAVFHTAADWRARAFTTKLENVTLVFPHPIDLLVAKLQRLARKDLRAFRMVYRRTGFPRERDLVRVLQNAVDLYRSPFPGERPAGDMFANTRKVWRELFHKDIDVQKRIIQPVLAERAAAYGLDLPDWKAHAARLASRTRSKRRRCSR